MSLPFDVLEQVVSHLSDSGQTLLALCHVSRDTYSLARPALYRFVELGPRSVFRTFLDNIAREPSLGRHVLSFVMQSELENNDLSLVIRVLGTMVNLRHLDVRCLDSVIRQDVGVLDVIKGLLHLRSITVSTGRSSSYVRVFTRLPAMRAVNVDGNLGYYQVKVFDELLLRSVTSLERLRIMGYYNFSDLLKGHSDLRWESVRDLEIRLIPESMEPTSLQVAHAFPSVERLDLTLSAAPATRLMSDPTLFPHVRDMTVRVERERVPRPAAHLVPGRRTVEHLTMHLSDAAPSLKLFADVFQWQALRSLQLHAGWIFDETIAVLNLCSGLYYLSLTVQSTALGFRRGVSTWPPSGEIID
ncbi:hypothetical protein EXIGLDRAFT_85874 [Exidia glandulosa HHB12029]|uniref:Uncharacterized protein n=1 Tax=Exidia glandulosa HHB12029 TaxID=1314781 RepID=A0A165HE67_EXIGL|nr:hypothetical protein EXIGLDRAFT_85874 [Exidia glandulosa HHB12029]